MATTYSIRMNPKGGDASLHFHTAHPSSVRYLILVLGLKVYWLLVVVVNLVVNLSKDLGGKWVK